MKTQCNKCGCDLEITSVTCGECSKTLPPNPVAGRDVEICRHKKSIIIECGGDIDFTEITIAAYLKACLERGNE